MGVFTLRKLDCSGWNAFRQLAESAASVEHFYPGVRTVMAGTASPEAFREGQHFVVNISRGDGYLSSIDYTFAHSRLK